MRLGKVAVILSVAIGAGAAVQGAKAESINSALVSAYTNNPQIASALLSVKSSAEDIVLRKAGRLPTIGMSATYSNSWSVGSGGVSNSDNATINGSYQHRLFDSNRTDALVEQARAFSEVAEQGLRNVEQNVLLSAATAYVNVVRDIQLVQLRESNVGFFRAQVQSAQDRLDVGEGTRVDVSQSEARLAQAVAAYRSAVNSLRTSQASYARWIGRAPQNLALDFNLAPMLPSSLEEALALAEADHPAIRSAIAQFHASQSASEAAAAAFGPTLDLIGSICAIECGAPGTIGASGSVRLTVSIPIYSGGANGATLRRANLEQIRSEVDALAARDQVRESVISAWSGLQNSVAQIESAFSAVEASQAVLEGVTEERDVGQRTTLDVLNAQAELTSARESRIIAQASQYIASFSLIAASGRLNVRHLGLPVVTKTGEPYRQKAEDIWQDLRAIPN